MVFGAVEWVCLRGEGLLAFLVFGVWASFNIFKFGGENRFFVEWALFRRLSLVGVLIFVLASAFGAQIYIYDMGGVGDGVGIAYAAVGPLSGVYVYAEPANSSGDGSSFAITGSNGQYNMTTGLVAGKYNLTAFATGYISSKVGPVTVVAGQTMTGVNLVLHASGGISGKVTDAVSGAPINGTFVSASLANGSAAFGWFGTTDDDGSYLLNTDLPTGTYNVSVFLPVGHIGNRTTVSVVAGAETKTVNLRLARSGVISGRVSAPNGTGLFGVSVTAFSSEGASYFGSATTDVSGNYRIVSGLGTGNYTVYASGDGNYTAYGGLLSPTPIMVTAGQERSNINIQLKPVTTPPVPSGTVSGRITDTSNHPIGSAAVTVSGSGGVSSNDTDSNGYYVVSSDLSTGTDYNVSVTKTGYFDAHFSTLISVTVGQTTPNINIQMTPKPAVNFGTITGTVTGDLTVVPEFPSFTVEVMTLALVATATVLLTLRTRRGTNKNYATRPN